MLLTSKKSSVFENIHNVTYQTAKRKDNLQIQGIIVRLISDHKVGFVYCRSTPNNPEIRAICKYFNECNILMGDFNLSHRNLEDQDKIMKLCQDQNINSLKEITRSISNNQLDYILFRKDIELFCNKQYNY